jgi:hypothetical protein
MAAPIVRAGFISFLTFYGFVFLVEAYNPTADVSLVFGMTNLKQLWSLDGFLDTTGQHTRKLS